VTVTRPPQITATRFLAYGDSITWGKERPAAPILAFLDEPPATSYPTQLADMLSRRYLDQTIVMVNEGWPGEAINDGLIRLPGVISSTSPHVLLLIDGANDLLGRPDSATTAYIASRLQDMVRTAKRSIPNTQILLGNFPPQYHSADDYDRGAGADFVPELNQRIAEVAQAEGVTMVDLYSPLLPNLKQNISHDGLHPTIQGYTLIAETFAAAIRRTLEVAEPADTAPGVWGPQGPNSFGVPGSPAELRQRLPLSSTERPARRRSSGR
jgi:lysophospholipase L1-like esterase